MGAVAAVERDGVDRAVDVGVPRRDRVRRGRAEAERVVPGVAGTAVLDLGEGAHRVHGPAALHELADLLGGAGVRQRRRAVRRVSATPPPPALGWRGRLRRAGRQHATATMPAISAPRAPCFPHSGALVRCCILAPPVCLFGSAGTTNTAGSRYRRGRSRHRRHCCPPWLSLAIQIPARGLQHLVRAQAAVTAVQAGGASGVGRRDLPAPAVKPPSPGAGIAPGPAALQPFWLFAQRSWPPT